MCMCVWYVKNPESEHRCSGLRVIEVLPVSWLVPLGRSVCKLCIGKEQFASVGRPGFLTDEG